MFSRREGGNCHKEREDWSLPRKRDNNFYRTSPKAKTEIMIHWNTPVTGTV
jgi:hypothetical protein